jgi:hypothetical protein
MQDGSAFGRVGGSSFLIYDSVFRGVWVASRARARVEFKNRYGWAG